MKTRLNRDTDALCKLTHRDTSVTLSRNDSDYTGGYWMHP
jgi:hypothetical protein